MADDIISIMRRESWRTKRAQRILPDHVVVAVRHFRGTHVDRYEWTRTIPGGEPEVITSEVARELLESLNQSDK